MAGEQIGTDDYALSRVPRSARYSWLPVATQRFGQVSALSQFLLGSALGYGMTFWNAFWALTLGAVILEVASIFIGIIGMREGMQTSMLARWTGFGHGGSSLVGLAIGISLVGWFGIQSGVSAEGLHSLMSFLPVWAWSLVFGLAVTAIVLWGFGLMQNVAYVTVPVFLVLVGWTTFRELTKHNLGALTSSAPAGAHLSLVQGTTLVAGGFIVGAIITSDMTRFNRSTGDVVKQTLVGITLGEYAVGLAGVLLAHAVGTADIITIVTSSIGWVGVLIIVLGTLKINDWNLYSSGLGLVNFVGTIFGKHVNRGLATLVVGVVGSILAAAGILDKFTSFLTILGVAFPPIAGLMLAEYFVVRQFRPALDATRDAHKVPSSAPTWVPATLVIWAGSSLVGQYVQWGLPSVNSLVVAFLAYIVAGKLGLVRGVGTTHMRDIEAAERAAAAQPAPAETGPAVEL